jgi:hypothetical protein
MTTPYGRVGKGQRENRAPSRNGESEESDRSPNSPAPFLPQGPVLVQCHSPLSPRFPEGSNSPSTPSY